MLFYKYYSLKNKKIIKYVIKKKANIYQKNVNVIKKKKKKQFLKFKKKNKKKAIFEI